MTKTHYMPFSEKNYKLLKKSPYYTGGGCSFEYLRDGGFTGYLCIINGEMHGYPEGVDEDVVISGQNATLFKPVSIKIKGCL